MPRLVLRPWRPGEAAAVSGHDNFTDLASVPSDPPVPRADQLRLTPALVRLNIMATGPTAKVRENARRPACAAAFSAGVPASRART
jgi:hypothetical protein